MTPAQVYFVRYFAGLPTGPKVVTRASTYDALEARGWIEKCDDFPFHRTTPEGLEALAAHERNNA